MVSVLRPVIHGCQVGVEGHVGEVDVMSVADQDVVLVAMNGRVSRRVDDRFAGFLFVGAGNDGFVKYSAGRRIQANHEDATVEERASAGRDVGNVVQNEDTAVQRPKRFELAKGTGEPFPGRHPITPCQGPIVCSKTIDPTISRSEQQQPLVIGRRGVDPAAGRVGPERLTFVAVQRVQRVRVDGCQENLTCGDHWRRWLAWQADLPGTSQPVGEIGSAGSTTCHVLAVGGPIRGRMKNVG